MQELVEQAAVRPGCPWYDMYQKWGPANVKWCEERLCQVVQEPANTWSNLGYLIFALVIIFVARKAIKRYSTFYGVTLFIVGATSLFYHMTNNLLTQYWDFVGMFMLMAVLNTYNLKRLGLARKLGEVGTYLAIFILFNLIFFLFAHFGLNVQSLVGILVVFLASLEVLCRKKGEFDGSKVPIKHFAISGAIMLSAALFSAADAKRLICDPHNHMLQGHAIWHILSSIGLFWAWIYYRQFPWYGYRKSSE
jgi:hypothetical protein